MISAVLALAATSCKPEHESLQIVNRTTTDILVYRGSGPPPADTDTAPAGGTTVLVYGAKETLLFGLFTLHDASFEQELSSGLTVASPAGRRAYFPIDVLRERGKHVSSSVYRLEVDGRDLPP